MATTPGGLPYPVGTDKVVDGDDAIRALATAVDPAGASALAAFAPFAATWQVDPVGTHRTTLGGGRILARVSIRNVAAGSFTAGSTNLGTFPAASRGDGSTLRLAGWYVSTTGASAACIAIQIDLSTGATTGWLPAASSPGAGGLRIAFEAIWDAAASA